MRAHETSHEAKEAIMDSASGQAAIRIPGKEVLAKYAFLIEADPGGVVRSHGHAEVIDIRSESGETLSTTKKLKPCGR
jgi:hypothetical protein